MTPVTDFNDVISFVESGMQKPWSWRLKITLIDIRPTTFMACFGASIFEALYFPAFGLIWKWGFHYLVVDRLIHLVLTLAGTGHFAILDGTRGGGWYDPPAVRPLIELARRDKDDHVGRDERKPMIPDFKVSGQMVTSEVR